MRGTELTIRTRQTWRRSMFARLGDFAYDDGGAQHGPDDTARALLVCCRERTRTIEVDQLRDRLLDLVLRGAASDGGPEWGHAVWALSVAASRCPGAGQRARARAAFRDLGQQRSASTVAMTRALVGAALELCVRPDDPCARALVRDALDTVVDKPSGSSSRTESALLAYAVVRAGAALGDRRRCAAGLLILSRVMRDGTADASPLDAGDLADACAYAYLLTKDPRWLTGVNRAWRHLRGDAFVAQPLELIATHPASSILALLSTEQHMRFVRELR